ncbi:MAG: 4Fe-4S dicluster domain-containing protein [Candidatus Schekmanbacteria bacterium]|nr:MAG: 4Fe-4S dicluster domain-containing protein [Candidatus Schekmanbacteria bacterium]
MMSKKKFPKIDRDKCVLCLSCIDLCLYNAIKLIDERIVINGEKCVFCGDCINGCPYTALYESM